MKQKSSFLWVQTNSACRSNISRFCKINSDLCLESLIVTRVESSHSVKKRDSSRVRFNVFLYVTRVESESPKIETRVESSHWLESRLGHSSRVSQELDPRHSLKHWYFMAKTFCFIQWTSAMIKTLLLLIGGPVKFCWGTNGFSQRLTHVLCTPFPM